MLRCGLLSPGARKSDMQILQFSAYSLKYSELFGALSRMAIFDVDLYRLKTRARAFWSISTLDERTIDAFMRSYVLFDGDWTNGNGKREEQIVDYYAVINHLCALGNVEKMYIPPVRDASASVTDNQVLFEQKMMRDIGATSGDKVLDIGCGRGRVASHIASHTGARVIGINIDPNQLENARHFVRREGLDDRCEFLRSSLNDPLPFADGWFDAAYQIQAFTYAKDKDAVFRELFRVLRPGSRFSYLDWVLLPAFDPDSDEHVNIVDRTRPFIGAVDTPTVGEIEDSMKKAGFEIVLSENASKGGHQSPLITSERKHFALVRKLVAVGVRSGLVPQHVSLLLNRLKKDAEAFLAADEMRLATTSYQIVGEKPR